MAQHNLFGLTLKHLIIAGPLVGFAFGGYLDYLETMRMTSYRDRSALYGRPIEKRTQPSWPVYL